MQQSSTILPPPPLPDGTPSPARPPAKEANLVRFQAELEFVQCLSHPQYLHSLSTQGYLTKPSFINYLKYLEYWREPEYVKFIVYPTCLVYLTLLQSDIFRSRLNDPGFIGELMRVGVKHHETWRVDKPPTKVNIVSKDTAVDEVKQDATQDQDED
ncbi:uncharacterized protein IL334_005119 [Kwoniella shivajii]|uniref:Mediator of RNA polymerase II transcription subunit 31 n=1 Tax=Kwoniella shivajii TaxID=564305 RepID=A0ABZ1D3Q4_9TREE|nr:hypothetical protein IL334_005119 [Kwoniella shivajii]